MDFQLTEEQTLIQDMARQFAQVELAPHSAMWDEEKFLDICAAPCGGRPYRVLLPDGARERVGRGVFIDQGCAGGG